MPKIAKELSDIQIKRLSYGIVKGKRAGTKKAIGSPCVAYHPVGGVAGLLLQCSPPEAGNDAFPRSWILRTTIGSVRRDIGLGGYPDVPVTNARAKAREIKEQIKQGIDPIAEKKAKKSMLISIQAKRMTFEQVASEYLAKKAKEFKTPQQSQKLENQLKYYAFPIIGKMLPADIELVHIIKMLTPIWETKTETAMRVRLHTERILDLAGVMKLRSGDNPARWRGNLSLSLPEPSKVTTVQSHKSLPADAMPEFWAKITQQDSCGSRALQFLILTAARSIEVRGAIWEEIDLNKKLWAIPANRMKAGKAHNVPLSEQAIKLLQSMPRDNQYIFPSITGKKISDVQISKAPKLIGYDVTAHGFRSTFKDWARKYTSYADEISELALAHVNDDKTRAAYARDELLDKRRLLMNEWQEYCLDGLPVKHSANVASIRSK